MPTLLHMDYARPWCRARLIVRGGQRQHGVHVTCYHPMRYDHVNNVWRCPACKAEQAVENILARRAGYE